MSVNKKYMDLYLTEIYKNYVAIKDEDYKKSQEVFKGVFDQVKQKMGENCKYFGKYSNQVLYAGSVYDGIKVSKLDEFDMNIVIRLPINYEHGENGIILEKDEPGFLKMKITNAFDNLDKQQEWEERHKVTRDWRDGEKYFLQNKFRAWMHGVVQKAVNDLKGEVTVNGVLYLLQYTTHGPAFTLNVRNSEDGTPFNLDVDLVPVIRFSHPRWPEGYRQVDGKQSRDWLLVPKPAKDFEGVQQNRCWRLSFQDFERDMMKGCQQLKITIRLVKKLRDALGLKAIASYYIKTLFLWRIAKQGDRTYWQNKISFLFQTMVEDLHNAIKIKNIPYFWNEDNNLIKGLKDTHKKLYEERLLEVINSLKASDIDRSVAYLLTAEELAQYKESEFYKNHLKLLANVSLKQQVSVQSGSSNGSQSSRDSDFVDVSNATEERDDASLSPSILEELMSKVDKLMDKLDKMAVSMTDKMDALNDKVDRLSDQVARNDLRLKQLGQSTTGSMLGDIDTNFSLLGHPIPETALLH